MILYKTVVQHQFILCNQSEILQRQCNESDKRLQQEF